MSELQTLERREALLLFSTRLQRANIAARLDRTEAHPARALLGAAIRILRQPWARHVCVVVLGFAHGKLTRRSME